MKKKCHLEERVSFCLIAHFGVPNVSEETHMVTGTSRSQNTYAMFVQAKSLVRLNMLIGL